MYAGSRMQGVAEKMRGILRQLCLDEVETPSSTDPRTDVLARIFKDLTNKPVKFKNDLDQKQMRTVRWWANAFQMLAEIPSLWSLFQRECKGVLIGLPEQTEDAQWRPDKWMFIATSDAGYEPEHMLRGLIHELGHAFEEALDVVVSDRNSLYGNPPFVDNYAATNPTEDFAETFMTFFMRSDVLRQTCPQKYEDMAVRVREI